jgi:predicted glycogen debranching enzyme
MAHQIIRLDAHLCTNLEQATQREWLETNGLGGFASSTVAGINTRRYHGLLTAATKPPVGRMVLLSKFEETLVMEGRRYELSANRYAGAVHPRGFEYLREFRLDPFPVFIFHVEGIELEKRIFMPQGENTVVVEYEIRGLAPPCGLELRPLIACRDYHSTTHVNSAIRGQLELDVGQVTIHPYDGVPALCFAHNAAHIGGGHGWYYNFAYEVERERGLDFLEDLFNPFLAIFPLNQGPAVIIASTERRNASLAASMRQREIERRAALAASSPSANPFVTALTIAASQFIVQRGDLKTIIAGYPWFSDWGRDTMIALPGLTLVTGRHQEAREILLAFARSADRGMLPNRFPDHGESPEYNTADATLWYFEAVRSYLHYSGDLGFVQLHLYDVLREIVEWHIRGTRYGICADEDGLLMAGEPGVQLTWMDAKIGDWVVTPRYGKPVEIQALWYNALRIMEDLAIELDDPASASRYAQMADLARVNFNRQFWRPEAGCLFDVVSQAGNDASIRPNQIFAVSLPHSMLPRDKARQVVDVVRHELLTPVGLRSLSPRDPQYRPRYTGDPWSRDSAYHQGTVWPWLLGPFITAYVEVNGRTPEARRQARDWLAPFERHLREAGLGQISEIFDAEPPHWPRGCFAQAWSVAELLRAAVEDVLELAPRPERKRDGVAFPF